MPGALNDLDIFEVSPHFTRVLNGTFLAASPSYKIDGKLFDWFHYLTDGIFQPWKIFVKSIVDPSDKKAKVYPRNQEAIWKCIEWVFRVLFHRFCLSFIACEFWTISKIRIIATSAVILHTMIVETERETYTPDATAGRRFVLL